MRAGFSGNTCVHKHVDHFVEPTVPPQVNPKKIEKNVFYVETSRRKMGQIWFQNRPTEIQIVRSDRWVAPHRGSYASSNDLQFKISAPFFCQILCSNPNVCFTRFPPSLFNSGFSVKFKNQCSGFVPTTKHKAVDLRLSDAVVTYKGMFGLLTTPLKEAELTQLDALQ